MRKALAKKIIQDYSLEVVSRDVLSGEVQGYYTTISIDLELKHFEIIINAAPSEGRNSRDLEAFLEDLRAEYGKVKSAEYRDFHISIQGKPPIFTGALVTLIHAILDQTTSTLKKNKYTSGCAFCSENQGISLAHIKTNHGWKGQGNEHVYSCQNCFDQKVSDLEEERITLAQIPEKRIAGTVGALLGACVGGVLWIIMGQLGYISGVSGLVAAVCSFYGYRILGGKVSRVGAIICFLISIDILILASLGDWGIYIYRQFRMAYDITIWDAFQAVPEVLISNKENLKSFMWDLSIGLGFTLLGGGSLLFQMYRQNKGDYTASREEK